MKKSNASWPIAVLVIFASLLMYMSFFHLKTPKSKVCPEMPEGNLGNYDVSGFECNKTAK